MIRDLFNVPDIEEEKKPPKPRTTKKPTTLAPTTRKPTTVKPTTRKPTTVKPKPPARKLPPMPKIQLSKLKGYGEFSSQILFLFFSHVLPFMFDANFIYNSSLIICYSSTLFLLLINSFFSHIYLLCMVDANFIFILVFISPYFRSVWHPFSYFILRMGMVYLV